MGLTKIRLGDYIERSTENNSDLKYGIELITGVNSQGIFAFPKGNTQGVDLKPYKIVKNGAFVYNPTRLDLGSLAYRTEGLCIVSHLYMVFYLNEKGKKTIDPMYLYMYFQRREFCREVTFRNFGSQRPEFNFNDMSDIVIPLPDIETQQKYVAVYNAMFANQRAYEQGLEDLKLTCDAYIERLRHELPHIAIGAYVEPCDQRNDSLEYGLSFVRGISIEKRFIQTKANMDGVSLKPYKLIEPDAFSFVTVTSRNGEKISLACNNSDETYICSSSYEVFRVSKKDKLLASYLMMFFSRTEFDRYTRFHSWGSARETFTWDDMCAVRVPIPDINVQQYIINIYTVYQLRREINEQLKAQIKDLFPILIKGSLEEATKV